MDSKLYTRPDTEPHPAAEPAPSLREAVYAQLRSAVLDGEFGPRERLAEMRLAARFGVSRTPVREALARLLGGRTDRARVTEASSSPSPT
ncbi:GntR family transcriptional regulator [Streptomyces sp. NPDC059786]|uniref:GntR family transcriptional regulator n=1 Tax=Streptomyces sp. NPDC059786 TaxID=3346946 RepID=UPI003647F2AC